MDFSRASLKIDPQVECLRLVNFLRKTVHQVLRRQGGVVGISGGVDSAVVLGLCVRAFSADKVVALFLPEKESAPESKDLALKVARHFGVEPLVEDITPALEGFNCYARRDRAIRRVFPDYNPAAGHKAKIFLPEDLLNVDTFNYFQLSIVSPEGDVETRRLGINEYLDIVAATNFKQRTRMAILYYQAEKKHYAVIGTANKNEHDQGFFVKYGDAGVDIKPIAHLYKTQVYALAEYLDVPAELQNRPSTSDTYAAETTQEEFYFRLPFHLMDPIWYGQAQGYSTSQIAEALGLTAEQIQRAFNEFDRKARTTDYLRMGPIGTKAEPDIA